MVLPTSARKGNDVADFLMKRLGLTLHPEKTRLSTSVTIGQLPGYRFIAEGGYIAFDIADKRWSRIRDRTPCNHSADLSVFGRAHAELNEYIRGASGYYRKAVPRTCELNRFTLARIARWHAERAHRRPEWSLARGSR